MRFWKPPSLLMVLKIMILILPLSGKTIVEDIVKATVKAREVASEASEVANEVYIS